MKKVPAVIVPISDPQVELTTVGGKGVSLSFLMNAGLPVPECFCITTEAYRVFVDENQLQPHILETLQGVDINQPDTLEKASAKIKTLFAGRHIPPNVVSAIQAAYAALASQLDKSHSDLSMQPALPVAVRSSATAEDLPGASLAGQHETFLNVRGAETVLNAVKHCWASLWTARAISYRVQQGIDHAAVSMGVVVQKMVPADVSGIMFTANPVNGRRDHLVINASWGLGEAVVGGSVTPDTFTVDKESYDIVEREISLKETMTILIEGGTDNVPVSELHREIPSLNDNQVAELSKLGMLIESHFNRPMDIEWALAEGEFAIVQARPITVLPEANLSGIKAVTTWVMPDPKAVYSRSSVVELLPDPLTPLYATMGIQAVNAGTMRLFTDLLGKDALEGDMVITINSFAYIGMRLTPKFWFRILTRVWGFLPQFFRGEARWRAEALPQYMDIIQHWQERPVKAYSPSELIVGAYQISVEAVNIYNVYQSGVVGLAMASEMLFTTFYEKFIRRNGDSPALDFILGGNSIPIQAEKSLYDVAMWCREHPVLVKYILDTPVDALTEHYLRHQSPPDIEGEWSDWQHRLRTYLEKYGHIVYDLDFAKPVPADEPSVLLATVKMYLNDQGANPYERQKKQLEKRDCAAEQIRSRLKGLRLKWFDNLLGWAQKYIPMREDNLADIGLGYPLLRQMLRELGARFVTAGVLNHADDIFWLSDTDIADVMLAIWGREPQPEIDMSEPVRQRKAVWQAAKRMTPPVILPERSGLGKILERFLPAAGTQEGDSIKGIGASPGRVTGPAIVLHGPEDFNQMQPGTVLVAAITTPAWTPLFAMASAIVTDVGGPLSHGSIVAREYGIPAVLGTGVATKRIKTGQMITVDGNAGTVTLLENISESGTNEY